MFFRAPPALIRSRRCHRAEVHRRAVGKGGGDLRTLSSFFQNIATDRLYLPPFSRKLLCLHYPAMFHVERPIRLPERLSADGQGGEDQLAMQWRHLLDEAH